MHNVIFAFFDYRYFQSKRLPLHNDILRLTYNSDALNTVENEKVLGVRIDNNLTWSIHINLLLRKVLQIYGYYRN